MSSGAPANLPVTPTGNSTAAQCDVAIPGTCTADPSRAVDEYLVGPNKDQTNACKPCYEQMILAGQWVAIP